MPLSYFFYNKKWKCDKIDIGFEIQVAVLLSCIFLFIRENPYISVAKINIHIVYLVFVTFSTVNQGIDKNKMKINTETQNMLKVEG